jgi:hypothetical protein
MPDLIKPGCYGSSLCYQATAGLCAACPLKAACGVAAEAMAVKLRDKYGFNSVDLRKYRTEGRAARRTDDGITVSAEAAEAGLSQNAEKLVRRINMLGIDLNRSLSLGINAFETGPGYLRVLLDMVLAGSFTRAEARQTIERELGWAEQSAHSHVSFALQALVHLGVVENREGVYGRVEVMA